MNGDINLEAVKIDAAKLPIKRTLLMCVPNLKQIKHINSAVPFIKNVFFLLFSLVAS